MIEVKLKDILNCQEDLVKDIGLKARVMYQIARIFREVEREQELYTAQRDELIKKHYSKDESGELLLNENGQPYILYDTPEYKEFIQENNDMLETIIKINAEPIDLKDIEESNFTYQQMSVLAPFIRE